MKLLMKIFILATVIFSTANANGFPDDYYKLNTKEAKKYFFDYFKTRIEIENRKILLDRRFIQSLDKKAALIKSSLTYKRLKQLQEKYKIKNINDYKTFLRRIDIIPPSLALAQAAVESGWGKSRFFKQANNIFGHWTYDQSRGMVPLKRSSGKKHLIRIFPTLQDSIAAYMLNLNRTSAYKKFRAQRAMYRTQDRFLNGYVLSSNMTEYSGIGHNYVNILKSIIKKSYLTKLDKEFYEKIEKTS